MDINTTNGQQTTSNNVTKPTSGRAMNGLGKVGIAVVLIGVGYFLGQTYGVNTPDQSGYSVDFSISNKEPESKVIEVDMKRYWDVLDLVGKYYIDSTDIDPEKLVDGAISGMVSSLGDPYTSYYTAEENEGFKDGLEGLYEGIGAQLGYKDDQLIIVAPLAESPAEQAGVRSGDYILAVDGESTTDWSLPKAVDSIRGPAGEPVVLTLAREGKEDLLDISVTRSEIRIPAVRLEWREGNVAYVRVLRFGSDTKDAWDEVVQEMVMGGAKGVVLDVRNNPGGLLSASIYLGSEFFPDGVVVKRQTNTGVQEFDVDHRCRLCDVPVVGLINEGSASASEILAGALQSRGRAELVGVQSFGKGTVQEALDLSGGAAVHITTAKWLLPNDQNIHGDGLTPEYVVEADDISGLFEEGGTDPQLEKALELLKSEIK